MPELVVGNVESNIVNVDSVRLPAAELVSRLAKCGVLVNAVGEKRLRAVTHRDVGAQDLQLVLDAFARSV